MINEFIAEIEKDIKHKNRLQNVYRIMHISLGVIIAGCGFLTAAASQTEMKTTWISSPTSLLLFGLLTSVCAIVNQLLAPGEAYNRHHSVKQALEYIRGEVKFRNMSIKEAQSLRTLARTNTALVWNRSSEKHTQNAKRS